MTTTTTETTAEGAPAPLRLARRMSRMPPSAVREILKVAEQPDVISFAGGLPAPEFFPVAEIAAAHAEALAREGRAALQYSTTEGYLPLRAWIAARMAKRGIKAAVEDLIITSGSQQGIDLVGRVLLDPGDAVAVESPSYLAALQSFAGCEAEFVAIASDDDGMQIESLERAIAARPIKLIYIVPEFQNPKGTTLARERRAALVKLAAKHRIVVLEDNPYGELRFRGEPLPALASYEGGAGVVVHLGTFSKTLAPGLRIAWLTGPREIVRAVTIAKQANDLHTATLAQRAAARLLDGFDYDAHIATISAAYGERCVAMTSALARYMPPGTRWTDPAGGLFVWVELPRGMNADAIFADALREKVAFVPGSGFFPGAPRREFLRLNFSNRPAATIEEGMARLGAVVRRSASD